MFQGGEGEEKNGLSQHRAVGSPGRELGANQKWRWQFRASMDELGKLRAQGGSRSSFDSGYRLCHAGKPPPVIRAATEH